MTEAEVNQEYARVSDLLDAIDQKIEALEAEKLPLYELIRPLQEQATKFTIARFEAEDTGKMQVRRCQGDFTPNNVAYSEKQHKREVVEGLHSGLGADGMPKVLLRTHTFGARNANFWNLDDGRETYGLTPRRGIDSRYYIHPDDLKRVVEDPATPRL